MMYAQGNGVPQNFIYAYSWVNLAVSNGDKTAIKLRDLLAKQMSSSQVLKAQSLSIQNNREITQRQTASK